MSSGFGETPDWMRDLPQGSMRVSGFTDRRPKVTVAVADEGMPPGQQWVCKGGDYPCVAHVLNDKWVVVYSPGDPTPQLDEETP
jgi:hypothetical protein